MKSANNIEFFKYRAMPMYQVFYLCILNVLEPMPTVGVVYL